jgi:integral membrane sensor domain MASE1
VGVATLMLGQYAVTDNYAVIWLTWWMGDATGILIVTPAILLWARHPRFEWKRRQRLELGLLLFVLVVTCEVIFGPLVDTGQKYPLQFLLVPILTWAAFRFGPRETATLTVLMAGWATFGTINGRGPFVSESANDALLIGQAFLAVISITPLALPPRCRKARKLKPTFSTRPNGWSPSGRKSCFIPRPGYARWPTR